MTSMNDERMSKNQCLMKLITLTFLYSDFSILLSFVIRPSLFPFILSFILPSSFFAPDHGYPSGAHHFEDAEGRSINQGSIFFPVRHFHHYLSSVTLHM